MFGNRVLRTDVTEVSERGAVGCIFTGYATGWTASLHAMTGAVVERK